MQVGMYNLAIAEIQRAGYFVEAAYLMISLNELGLLPTRQDIVFALKPDSLTSSLIDISKHDLELLYEKAVDYDASLLGVVSKAQAD